MKTHFLTVVSAALLLMLACNPQPKEESGGTVPTSSAVAVAANEKEVRIEIYEDPTKPGEYQISGPIPNVVCLSRGNKDKIRWCIIASSCSIGASWRATVKIDTFVDPKNTTKKNPFGDNSDPDNVFDISNVKVGRPEECNKLTQEATGEKGYYKYTIHVTVTTGGGTVIPLPDLDPGAVIAD
jgi:hypothetical protein